MTSAPRSLPLVALALGVAILVVQIRVIAGGQTWDDVRYHTDVAPPRLAAADQVGRGEPPAWWDGSGLGVPLAGEPSHGALYPPMWLAVSPHALDLVMIAHLAWAALGVAVWTRRRASDRSALIAGVLIATTGILASSAVRGALPALAHVPWLGAAVEALAAAGEARARLSTDDDRAAIRARAARAAAAIAALIGAIALVGELAVVGDALVLALVVGARRTTWRHLAAAIGAGLAIGAAQWLPAILQLPASTGGEVVGLPLARVLELVVPSAAGAGDAAWAPSVFVGAPLLALAAVRAPSRRVLGVLGGFAAAALLTGRGGWPAWTGAPELHLAALAIVLAVGAGDGLDAVIAGQRRGVLALALAAGLTALALAAFAALRVQHAELAPAIDRALINGGLGVGCMAGAAVLAWRAPGAWIAALCALLVAPSAGGAHALAPMIDRAIVGEPPASDADGYATVSSTAAAGWSVTVDDRPTDWLTADVLRRAVWMPAGSHRVHWTYAAPGLALGGGLAVLGALGALALAGLGMRRSPPTALD
jgi:hypothetical protein